MIVIENGKQHKFTSDLEIEVRWVPEKEWLEIVHTKKDGTKKTYILRKSFKDGIVLN